MLTCAFRFLAVPLVMGLSVGFVQAQSGRARLEVPVVTNGTVLLQLIGSTNAFYVLEGSPTLTGNTWTALSTNVARNGTFVFIDQVVSNSARFYRVRQTTNPPPIAVINELETSPSTQVFVELFMAVPMDLNGYRIVSRGPAATNDTLLVALTNSVSSNSYLFYVGAAWTGPTPNGALAAPIGSSRGSLALRDRYGNVMDSVCYGTLTNLFVEGSPAPAPVAGLSIARLPNGVDTEENSFDFQEATPTPGASN